MVSQGPTGLLNPSTQEHCASFLMERELSSTVMVHWHVWSQRQNNMLEQSIAMKASITAAHLCYVPPRSIRGRADGDRAGRASSHEYSPHRPDARATAPTQTRILHAVASRVYTPSGNFAEDRG